MLRYRYLLYVPTYRGYEINIAYIEGVFCRPVLLKNYTVLDSEENVY